MTLFETLAFVLQLIQLTSCLGQIWPCMLSLGSVTRESQLLSFLMRLNRAWNNLSTSYTVTWYQAYLCLKYFSCSCLFIKDTLLPLASSRELGSSCLLVDIWSNLLICWGTIEEECRADPGLGGKENTLHPFYFLNKAFFLLVHTCAMTAELPILSVTCKEDMLSIEWAFLHPALKGLQRSPFMPCPAHKHIWGTKKKERWTNSVLPWYLQRLSPMRKAVTDIMLKAMKDSRACPSCQALRSAGKITLLWLSKKRREARSHTQTPLP